MNYSLTNSQNSIWLTEKFYTGQSVNNICGYVYIQEKVNFNALSKAINEVVKTNDSMRLKFQEEKNSCFQHLNDYEYFNVDIIELSSEKDIEKTALEMANIPFETKDNFLFKFILFKLPNNSGGFIVNLHHIISDSWTLGLVAKEITGIYSEILNNSYEEKEIPSYLKYINSEKEYFSSEKYIKDKEYWNEIFKTVPEVATIPSTKETNHKNVSCKGAREKFVISEKQVNDIKEFCTKNKISVYNFFMAIYSLYVGRVSGLDDFVIGTPILNRTNFEQKHTMGMFISTVPLRINLEHEKSFTEFCKTIASNSMSLLRHQKYPYQSLLEDLRKKDTSIPNLYNVILSYQITKTVEVNSSIKYSTDWIFNGNCADDLQIHLFDLNDESSITVAYDYKIDKYNNQDIADLHARILTIINQVMPNNDILLKDIEIVTPEEKHQILYEFNNTKVDYPRDKTIVDLFEEQVEKTPDNIAVIFEDQKLTYKELNEKANQLAKYICDLNISKFSNIGVLLKRSIDIYICILGILKSNHNYMLIDSMLPKERIEYMLKNSNSSVLLTTSFMDKEVSFDNIIFIDKINYTVNNKNLVQKISPISTCCIIYTSGSTGTPKGVILTHRGIVNMFFSYKKILSIDKLHVFLSMSTISFDMFAVETFISLLSGGTIVLTNENEQQSPQKLHNLILDNNVDFILTTPSKIELLMIGDEKNCLKNVKTIQLGGEIFTPSLYKKLSALTDAAIYNGYGPTESTACCSSKKITNTNITIGTPFCNTNIFICSKNLNLLPVGVIGELCVSGDGVSLGYVNNELLTQKSFVKSNFLDNLIYKTGDLAYWDKSGEIRYVKRNDNQIKLRGLRIELDEISMHIKEINGVKNCITIIKEVHGNKSICSYICVNRSVNIEQNYIKKHLKQYLPDYMIPNFIVFIDNMPLTLNGKIDTKKLPDIVVDNNIVSYASTKVEKKLENICKKYLEINSIDIYSSLFEIGGDSLFAIKFAAEICNAFGVDVTVQDIFKYSTIKSLSDYISSLGEKENTNTIKKANKMQYYPLSSAQKRIYLASSIENNSTLYNIIGGIIVDKSLNIDKLQSCFKTLISRHEVLRTHFDVVNDEIVQIVDDNIDFNLCLENTISDDLNKIYNNFVNPFDLSKAPLFRTKLVKLNDNKMLLLLDMHHIISDGTSLKILMQELCTLYNGEELSNKTIDYTDFCVWEHEQFKTEEFNNKKEFWINQFKDEIPLLNMPTTYSRPSVQSFEGTNYYANLSEETINKILETSNSLNITPYMLMLSCYYILLSKYTSQDDIVVGTPIVGRELPELSNMLGMFVNTLALRNKIDSSLSFEEFSKNIKENCLNSFKNQSYPFDMLVKDLDIKRDPSRNPLFDTMFSFQNEGFPDINFKDINSECYIPNSNISKFDISLDIMPKDREYLLRFEYCTKLFDEEFIARFSSHYINILNAVIENSNIKLYDIDMLSEKERNQILYEFNNTKVDYPRDKTIVDLFEEQVEKTPDNIAVVFEDQKLTYRELNEKANQLANYLISKNVKNGDIIGVCLNKGLELIISIFAILKCGAVYMPMYIGYPAERLDYMLSSSMSKLLITNNKYSSLITLNINKVIIDNFHNNPINQYNKTNIKPDDLAYVIYTSGSTGKPKGVKISHRNLINFVYAFNKYYKNNIMPNDSFLSSTNIAFDVSIWEIFMPLLNGATLVFNSEEIISDIHSYCNNIIKNKITALYIPPNILDEVYQILSKRKYQVYINKLLVGVEPIKKSVLNKYYNLNSELIIINGYGPTETTICATALSYKNNNEKYGFVSIGKPLYNNKIYIVDKNTSLCPINVLGELCVAGDGLGNGYLNNEKETKKAFVLNPFDEGLIYKTGDLAFWNSDGTITFVGRIDNQIKLSGYRIELGEINNCINQYDSIKSSFSTTYKSTEKEYIVSYFIAKNNVDTIKLNNYLNSKLPFYMIPRFLIQLETFPLTPNGKIDKNKLPLPKFDNDNYMAPQSYTEKELTSILTNLTGITKIGINDNLFEIGIDSLVSIKLTVKILETFNTTISAKDIFEYPTIKALASFIDIYGQKRSLNTIRKADKMQYYPLSSAQKRIYLASNIENDSTLYNIAGGIVVDKVLDINKLKKCFNILINRHEALRTRFDIVENEVVQIIEDNIDFELTLDYDDTNDFNKIYTDFIKPFDLSKAPLFRTKLVKLNDNKMLLLLDMHHIISDGTSLGILLQELCDLYNDNELAEKELDYKDFTLWEKEQFESDEFKKTEEYWVNQFKDEIPLLNMPTTYPRPSIQSFEGQNYHINLSEELFNKVNEVAKKLNITRYMLMLSCYYILLSKYTSQDDIVVGTPIVGRELPELSNMLGMFVNTLALRNKIDSSLSFEEFSKNIKENCLNSFKNQSYPFDMLVKELNIKRDTSRTPLFDVMFIYQNNGYPEINFKDTKSKYLVPDNNVAKFDLSLEVIPIDNEYSLRFEYCSKLFDEKFIKRFCSHYINILNTILENDEIKIADIDMLSEEEKHQILFEFNNTKVDYPRDKTIVDLFEEQVEKTPDNIAVVFEDQKLTYRELNEKANQLARYLIKQGVSSNSIVGIMVPRSLEMIIGILGVLKSGTCYIPIDPSFPRERIEYMLQNSNALILLKTTNIKNISFENMIDIDITNTNIYELEKSNINKTISPESLSYVIYTSGSTGKPKGVVLKHKALYNLANYLNNNVAYFKDIYANLSIVSITTISFDIFLFETIISLQRGLKVIIANEKEQTNPTLLDSLIEKHNVKAIQMTPSRMEVFINNRKYIPHLSELKYITLAGEALSSSLKNELLKLGNITIYNGYGPSETTVFSTFTNVTKQENITIGKPLSNTYMYVIDKDNHLCPIGVPGELYISGDGVGNGYLNNKDLTNKSFIKDNFNNNLTMYKTGDLVKLLPNNELHYIGRTDNQVKIRGLRIELDEIKKWISEYKDVNKVVLSSNKDNNGRQYIVAYLTVTNRISINNLKMFLNNHIPKYMIPTHFIILDNFPYLPNGKINKKALPLPNEKLSDTKKYIAPINKLEIDIIQIFEKLLSISPISTDDNFFDIGGDSLLAMSLQLELLKLNINVTYSDIFMFPSAKELANHISADAKKAINKIDTDEINKFDTILNSTINLPDNLKYTKTGNILLTGVTGFLGAHILDTLLKNETGLIYCFIRLEPGLTIEQKLLNKLHYYFGNKYDSLIGTRIIPIKADILIGNFGLTDIDLKDLADKIDIVINSAAKVSHYGNYGDYKKVNVDGTQNLSEFSLKNNKRFYQISTLSVSGNSLIDDSYIKQKFENDIDFNENNFYINQALDNVYVRSKFEAERIVLKNILNGLDGYIIRVGNLMNRFSDGKFQANVEENAYINRLLTYYKIGYIPDYILNSYLELTPVDYCAKAILKIIQYNSKTNRIFHLLNHKNINVLYFIDTLNKFYDKIEIVNNEKFIKVIDKILNNPSSKNILSGLINDFDENKLIVYSSPVKIKSDFTVKYLNKIGFEWPELTEEYIIKFLKFFEKLNLLNRKDDN